MTPPTIRRARVEDAVAITALVQAAYAPYLTRMPRRPAPMDDDYTALITTGDVWVAELPTPLSSRLPSDNAPRRTSRRGAPRLVGVVVMTTATDHLLVDNIAVAPSAQGTGIGSRLLQLVDETACAAGVPEIRLYTNVTMTENIAFYPRHGYVETRRAMQDGFERVFFSRHVPQRDA